MSDSLLFLQSLWGEKVADAAIQLWRKSDKKSFYYAQLDPASAWVDGNSEGDIYMAAGLAAKVVQPNKRRTLAREIVGIPGVWADIDVNGGPEGKTGAAPSVEEAQRLAEQIIQPTVLVNSGYGLQAWWLFESGPWMFNSQDDRDRGERVVRGFQGALRDAARKRGYSLDSTFDLARLMRIPGSFNHKGSTPTPVELLDDGGTRYSIEHLEEVGQEFQSSRMSAMQLLKADGIEIEVSEHPSPPLMKLEMLKDVDDDFRSAWDHKPTKKEQKSWSMSHWEFSLTNYMVRAGWTDQEICDTLVFHRLRYEPGDPKSKNRAERIAQTIGKVRATVQHADAAEQEEQEQEEATDQLVALGRDGGLDPAVTLSLFNRIIGGPEIKEFIQIGRSPETARFFLKMANGDEIPIGPIRNLTDQREFRNRFATVTSFYPKGMKPEKWDKAMQTLLSAVHIRDEFEDSSQSKVLDWLRSYCENRTSTDKNNACIAHDPFTKDGALFVPLGQLHQYVRKVRGERIESEDLKALLESTGFERKTINYTKDNGDRSTRSYFVAPQDTIDA